MKRKILKGRSNYADLLLLPMKTFLELSSLLRGVSFDVESYLDQLKTIDNIIIDMSLLVDAFEQQYRK